jgi:hypothetical protein
VGLQAPHIIFTDTTGIETVPTRDDSPDETEQEGPLIPHQDFLMMKAAFKKLFPPTTRCRNYCLLPKVLPQTLPELEPYVTFLEWQ